MRRAPSLLLLMGCAAPLTAQAPPAANPVRWFEGQTPQQAQSRFDGNAFIVTTASQPVMIPARNGPGLPDSARVEFTVTQDRCAGSGISAGFFVASGPARRAIFIELRGDGSIFFGPIGMARPGLWPAYQPGARRRVAFEIQGPVVAVSVDGREVARESYANSLAGGFGVVAGGPGCETRYEDMRVTFLSGNRAPVRGPAATRDGLALLDTTRLAQPNIRRDAAALTVSGTGGGLFTARGDAQLATPARIEATLAMSECLPGWFAAGIAFGAATNRPWALFEVAQNSWALRTLDGPGAAGELPAGLVAQGAPIRLAVDLVGTVATGSINGTVVGSVDLGRPLGDNWGLAKRGCSVRFEQVLVSPTQ